MKKINYYIIFHIACCLLSSALCFSQSGGVYIDSTGPAPVINVKGEPMLILGVEDPKGFSKGLWDNGPPWDYPRYYREADSLGFNTVNITFPWYVFETAPGQWEDTILQWHLQQALANNLKLIIIWAGSNFAGETNGAPSYIQNDTSYHLIQDSLGNKGNVYSWACQNIQNAEVQALQALAQWILLNDTNNVFIAIQLESEPRLPSAYDRSHDYESNMAYIQGGFTDAETFNQTVHRSYTQNIASAWKNVLPGFPIYLNVWPNEPGSPVPVPFTSPLVQQFVQGWLNDVPAVDCIGPDIYGWNPSYVSSFATGRNIVIVPEKGLQSPPVSNPQQTPYLDPFVLFDSSMKGIGLTIYQLVAENTHLFPGLLDRWTILGGQNFDWKTSAYYTRNSYRPLRDAMPVLARTHGTNFVRYFLLPPLDSTLLMLPDASVKIRSAQSMYPETRGAVVQTGTNDFTILGVGFEAIITLTTGQWSNPVIERGRWTAGAQWLSVLPAKQNSWQLLPDGTLWIKMDNEDVGDSLYDNLQYLVRAHIFTSVSENDINNQAVNIYPNPTSGKIQIAVAVDSGSKYNLEIYNMLGKKMYSAIINPEYSGATINLDFPDGIYFLQLISDDSFITRKLEIIR